MRASAPGEGGGLDNPKAALGPPGPRNPGGWVELGDPPQGGEEGNLRHTEGADDGCKRRMMLTMKVTMMEKAWIKDEEMIIVNMRYDDAADDCDDADDNNDSGGDLGDDGDTGSGDVDGDADGNDDANAECDDDCDDNDDASGPREGPGGVG